jgi:hypothetical protein
MKMNWMSVNVNVQSSRKCELRSCSSLTRISTQTKDAGHVARFDADRCRQLHKSFLLEEGRARCAVRNEASSLNADYIYRPEALQDA